MNIYNFTYTALENYFESISENKAKAKIVFNRLYKNRISSFKDITELNERVTERLSGELLFGRLAVLDVRNGTEAAKLLFGLDDGNTIEAVLMRHDYGNGLCVSTQIGCNMGCVFCESGRLKKIRDLEACEMVLQVLGAEQALNEKISHVTLMGIGEPLDNYGNVSEFIDIIGHQQGLDIAARHITISTCGLVSQMEMLAAKNTHNNLAVSLHAPNDEIRNALMPINRAYGIKRLMEAVKAYSDAKNKKTTLEYVLLKDINDSDICAHELCGLIKEIKCYVNLIPYNETSSLGYERPEKERIAAFYDILIRNGIRATVRREFGGGLKAACGQLRSENKPANKTE